MTRSSLLALAVLVGASCREAEARKPKSDEVLVGEPLPMLDEAPPVVDAPPTLAPDGTCEVLGQLVSAAGQSFVPLRGAPIDVIDIRPISDAYTTTVSLPGSAACHVVGPPPGGVAATLTCRRPLTGAADDAALYGQQVDAIGQCLDTRRWSREVGPTRTVYYSADPYEPVIRVAASSSFGASVDVELVAASPPHVVDSAEFCAALDVVVQKLGPKFEGSQPARPLPGMFSCGYQDRHVGCLAYSGEEPEVAAATLRYLLNNVASCLSTDEWTATQSKGATTFSHKTEKARVIVIREDWSPDPYGNAMLQKGTHGVTLRLGPD